MRALTWKDVPEEKVNENVTRKVFWGERVMLARFELAPNAELPLHDHVSEQVTRCERGSITLRFPGEADVTLEPGDMLVIPSSKPHSAKAGPHGAIVIDTFSPIRTDFLHTDAPPSEPEEHGEMLRDSEPEGDAYVQLDGYLKASGVRVPLEDLKDVPLPILARYAYERQCLTMGQLRSILGLDRGQAKALLKEWKHGDDHSEASYRRKLERMVVVPSGLPTVWPKPGTSDSQT
jgi:quercetin dioxygenase-like cupin family protein